MVLSRPSGIQAAKNREKLAASLLQYTELWSFLKDRRNANNKVSKHWGRISLKLHSRNRWSFFSKILTDRSTRIGARGCLAIFLPCKQNCVSLRYIIMLLYHKLLKHNILNFFLQNTKVQFSEGRKLILP